MEELEGIFFVGTSQQSFNFSSNKNEDTRAMLPTPSLTTLAPSIATPVGGQREKREKEEAAEEQEEEQQAGGKSGAEGSREVGR